MFKLGLHSFMNSISYMRQSNLLWHFRSIQNWLFLGDLNPHGVPKNVYQLPSSYVQQYVAHHRSTFICFYRRRKRLTQFYIKYYPRTLLIHFAPRVLDLPTFMAIPRLTKPISV